MHAQLPYAHVALPRKPRGPKGWIFDFPKKIPTNLGFNHGFQSGAGFSSCTIPVGTIFMATLSFLRV